MGKRTGAALLSVAVLLAVAGGGRGDEKPGAQPLRAALSQEFDLAGVRAAGPQRYRMESECISYAPDGRRHGRAIFRLDLLYEPAEDGVRVTCRRYTVQENDGPERVLPAMAGWSYVMQPGTDPQGQLFGIPQARFQKLTDADGKPLEQALAYHVFNSFVDFHALVDVFAAPMRDGRSIADLRRVGDKVVHAAADSEAPIHLLGQFDEGSTFENGRVALALKGLSLVDGAPCALLAYDSGGSSLQATSAPAPSMRLRLVGSSHYWGDIHVELASLWPLMADMTEVVVMQMTIGEQVVNSVAERHILLKVAGE